MNVNSQWKNRVHSISICLFLQYFLPCLSWHHKLTFSSQLSLHTSTISPHFSQMKFFMWYQSYAIYGARETLILLKPNFNTSSIEIFSYNWSIDSNTMDECLQEWNTKDKCYNDIVHVRILPNSTLMDVYCTYAHRPMVRSFDLERMSFVDEILLHRDPHPPMDSERSYVMLTFNTSIVTAGYQGDYIPTIRASHGKTLLYALRQNSYFIGGFKYDGKAVFGVVETVDRFDTNRISRLVMTCANRAEIIRKATLNCSTDMFDQSRSFTFHILTDLIDPIQVNNDSALLFATFTTNNSSLTASAVCLFELDKQFYSIFTSSQSNDLDELIYNCSQTTPSTIDRDTVESDREFTPRRSNPLLIETMSNGVFTALNVIEYASNQFCLIVGTSQGRLLTSFMNSTFEIDVYEELILPKNLQYPIQSITYRQIRDEHSYVLILTNQIGYFTVNLVTCSDKLCFQCWTHNCTIEKLTPKQSNPQHHCSTEQTIFIPNIRNQTFLPNDQSKTNFIIIIIIPFSLIIFLLSILIFLLLTKSARQLKRAGFYPTHSRKTGDLSYPNNIIYRTNSQKLFVEHRQSNVDTRRISSNPVYSTISSQSLPSIILSTPPNHSIQSYM